MQIMEIEKEWIYTDSELLVIKRVWVAPNKRLHQSTFIGLNSV